ncbi:hypothetical protein BHE74_00005250, partial [Ensete ventricosum]
PVIPIAEAEAVCSTMRETLRYLLGVAGPSGFGSSCTGEQVTQDIYCSNPSNLTAIITENLLERMIETSARTGIEGRIVNVSSVIHTWVKRGRFKLSHMLNPKGYASFAYGFLLIDMRKNTLDMITLLQLQWHAGLCAVQAGQHNACQGVGEKTESTHNKTCSVIWNLPEIQSLIAKRSIHHLLCGVEPTADRRLREVLRGLQRGFLLESGGQ